MTTSGIADPPAAQVVEDRLLPPGRTAVVARQRLLDLLDAGVHRPLTLVAAPAGSGKTVLLSEWANEPSRRRRTAWLTVEACDDSRRGFWIAVTAAIARVAGSRGELGGLRAPPRGPTDGFVTSFVNAARRLRSPFVLVLDDAHVLQAPEVMADLEQLLEHASPGLRLVLSTRVDPPLRLHRLRVAGALTEVRMHDLAFTVPEARAMLAAEGVALGERAVEQLCAKTDGWPVGLRLAALGLGECDDASTFVDAFAGDHRSVVDYLLDEVIHGLPPATVDFLLRTAGLRRVSASLADAVRRSDDGQDVLDDLVRRNLLVTPTDAAQQSFRYHQLFAEALLLLQRRRLGDEVAELDRRAALWHAQHGDPLEAMRSAARARDWRLVGRLLVEQWPRLALAGEGPALRGLATQLPERLRRGDAELALALAGLALEEGAEDEAERWLAVASAQEPQLPARRRERFAMTSAIVHLHRGRLRGDAAETLDAGREVLGAHWSAPMAAELRAIARTNLGVAEMWAGDLSAAMLELELGIAHAEEAGSDYASLHAHGWAALADLLAGRLVEARRKATAAIELATRRGWHEDPQSAAAHVAIATIAYCWNDLDVARQAATDARCAMGRPGERALKAWVAVIDAVVLRAVGEADTALATLRAGTCVDGEHPAPAALVDAARGVEARLRLALGEHEEAAGLARSLESRRGPIAAAAAAWVRLGLGDPAAASALAQRVVDDPSTPPWAAIDARVVGAICADMLGAETAALASLEQALDLAEPRGYKRPILDGGMRVGVLLRRLIRAGTAHRALAGELLDAFDGIAAPAAAAPAPLAEPLSDRELVVLRYMPTSLPYAEVASELFVSVNTVKTHARHVYRKLDVDSRRQAVIRARALRLLSPVGGP